MTKSVIAIGAGLVAAAAVVAPATHAVAGPAVTLWASPNGSGTTCSQAAPCALAQGASMLAKNGTLIVEPGRYVVDDPIVTADDTLIEGEQGQPMPLIVSTSTTTAMQVWSIYRIKLHYSGTADALQAAGSINHANVIATTGDDKSACVAVEASVTNSLCVNKESRGIALTVEVGADPVVVRGVTAVDTVGNGTGILVYEDTPNTDGTASLTNVIGIGTQDEGGVSAQPLNDGTDQNVTVSCDHSDFNDIESTSNGGGSGEVSCDVSTTVRTVPTFVSPAQNNYEVQPPSLTIDSGAPDPASARDLAGLPRTLGGAPDMGAYEFAPKPVLSRVQVIHTGITSVTMIAKVNPEGLPATVTAASGAHAAKPVKVVGDTAQRVQLVVGGLQRNHTYFLRVTAKSPGGTSTSVLLEART